MLKEKLLQRKSWIAVIIVLSAIFAGVYMIFSSSANNLPSYVDEPPAPTATPLPVPPPDTVLYTDDERGFSLPVPDGWQMVTNEGHNTFVNNRDGAKLQIQTLEYMPSLNMMDAAKITNDVASIGATLLDYNRAASDDYFVVYAQDGVVYAEYTVWDRQSAIRLRFIAPEASYADKYQNVMLYCFSNFAWNKPNPIPAGFMVYYNEFGNFEFGLPMDWSGAITDEGIYAATNPSTGASMYIFVSEYAGDFSGISQIDFAGELGQRRENFMMRSFVSDAASIAVEASYSVGGAQYALIQYRVCNGQNQYAFTFECPIDAIDGDLPAYQQCVSLFRYF
jgi:hypothetical protein